MRGYQPEGVAMGQSPGLGGATARGPIMSVPMPLRMDRVAAACPAENGMREDK
jgi:hypothetical protein